MDDADLDEGGAAFERHVAENEWWQINEAFTKVCHRKYDACTAMCFLSTEAANVFTAGGVKGRD
jgi:hypothetical protein